MSRRTLSRSASMRQGPARRISFSACRRLSRACSSPERSQTTPEMWLRDRRSPRARQRYARTAWLLRARGSTLSPLAVIARIAPTKYTRGEVDERASARATAAPLFAANGVTLSTAPLLPRSLGQRAGGAKGIPEFNRIWAKFPQIFRIPRYGLGRTGPAAAGAAEAYDRHLFGPIP